MNLMKSTFERWSFILKYGKSKRRVCEWGACIKIYLEGSDNLDKDNGEDKDEDKLDVNDSMFKVMVRKQKFRKNELKKI